MATVSQATHVSTRTQITATVIGNALEWYDFTVYGTLAVTISGLFFPAGSGTTAILSTLAIFGVAYVVRPFGGLVFGHYADLLGRKNVLFVVIGTMTLGIAMITFTPTYATIGIAAPIIMLVARVIQGFSVGGEFATSTTFLVEYAPLRRRFLYGSWQFAGQGAAVMLAGFVGTLVTRGLTHDQLVSWGWRLPFLVGLVIGPVGFYMRTKLAETPEFLKDKAAGRKPAAAPTMNAFGHYKIRMLCGLGLVLGGTASFYVLFIVMPTYAIRTLHLGLQASFIAPLVGGATMMVFSPIGGILADRFGRKAILGLPVVLLLLLIIPAFAWLAQEPSVARMAVLEFALSLLLGVFGGAFATAVADLFPVGVRATGMTVSYNFGVTLFGGFAPLIVTWLVATTGSPLAPAYYDMAGLILALIAVFAMPDAYRAPGVAQAQPG